MINATPGGQDCQCTVPANGYAQARRCPPVAKLALALADVSAMQWLSARHRCGKKARFGSCVAVGHGSRLSRSMSACRLGIDSGNTTLPRHKPKQVSQPNKRSRHDSGSICFAHRVSQSVTGCPLRAIRMARLMGEAEDRNGQLTKPPGALGAA